MRPILQIGHREAATGRSKLKRLRKQVCDRSGCKVFAYLLPGVCIAVESNESVLLQDRASVLEVWFRLLSKLDHLADNLPMALPTVYHSLENLFSSTKRICESRFLRSEVAH